MSICNPIPIRFNRPFRRLLTFPAILLLWTLSALPAMAANDFQIIDGFNKTVFGAEYAPFGLQSKYIRKFRGTVRFYIHDKSELKRTRRVKSFILSLNQQIKGLSTKIVSSKTQANFNVYIVDRKDYARTVQKSIYRRDGVKALGKCFVRSVFTPRGILRSDAIIVSDEGENLFQRCMAEEILQGLGPLNEHTSLRDSMFNDNSHHVSFTRFDRYILNMLYDPRIKAGMTIDKVQPLLPRVLSDARKRF